MARATKYFLDPKQLKDWMSLWYLVCQAPTLQEYKQVKVELQIRDLLRVAEYKKSLYDYVDGEYLANRNNQKHCYYWTNRITHFNKRVTSTAEGEHANIKRVLESTLGNLPEVVKVIRKKIEDQLRKVHFQHTYDKNGKIKATLNIGMFRYLRHEISEYALDLMASHAVGITVLLVLPQCTDVFTKTLGLPCKHKIQQSICKPQSPSTLVAQST